MSASRAMDLRAMGFGQVPSAEAARARRTLARAAAFGVFSEALFWGAPVGLNWAIWVVVTAACLLAGCPRPLSPRILGLALSGVLFGISLVVLRGDFTLALAIPGSLASLAALPALGRASTGLAGLAELPGRGLSALLALPRASASAARLVPAALAASSGARPLALGIFLGLPTALAFAALLSADAAFRAELGRWTAGAGEAFGFSAGTLAFSAGALVVGEMLRRAETGATTGAPDATPYRLAGEEAGRDPGLGADPGGATGLARLRPSPLAWAMVLGQVTLVFAIFALASARQLFGGHALVRGSAGLTYAAHLHEGFAQLFIATLLSVGLVVAGHALVRREFPEKGALGGRAIAILELALLGLTAVALASCALRLVAYEAAYGATRLRLGVAFVCAVTAGLLALTAAKVLARRWRGYGGAIIALGFGAALSASLTNADEYVALRNLDRAADGAPLDGAYLASLSADACAAIDHPALAARPELRARLARAWTPGPRTLRGFRGLSACRRGAIEAR